MWIFERKESDESTRLKQSCHTWVTTANLSLWPPRNISYTMHTSCIPGKSFSPTKVLSVRNLHTPQRTGTSPTIKADRRSCEPISRWYGRSQVCTQLSTWNSRWWKGLCEFCNPSTSKYVPLSKQRAVETYLRENTGTSMKEICSKVDRQLTQGCIKERPDFIFDLGDKMMVVKVDEHKHLGRAKRARTRGCSTWVRW
jgi:hypothetical protein